MGANQDLISETNEESTIKVGNFDSMLSSPGRLSENVGGRSVKAEHTCTSNGFKKPLLERVLKSPHSRQN